MKEVAPPQSIDVQTIVHSTLKFRELRMEWMIGEDMKSQQQFGRPSFLGYEESLQRARKQLFEEAMKHIQIDSRTMTDPFLYEGRRFRATLYVAENPPIKS